MIINFLGTAHGIAEKNRFRTSMLLQTVNGSYFFDLGAPIGTLIKNKGLPFCDVKAAFITHMHADHAEHICEYTELCNWGGNTKYLYLPEKGDIQSVKNWIYAMHAEELFSKEKCVLKNVFKGRFYDDGNLSVIAVPTKHLKRGLSFAYIAESGEKRILFTGDLTDSFADFPESDLKFDAVVCELTHFDVNSALDTLNGINTKQIIFNHVRDDKVNMLNACSEKIRFDFQIANDGDAFVI